MKTFQEFQETIDRLTDASKGDPTQDAIISTASRLASAASAVLTDVQLALADRSFRISDSEDMAIQTHISDILLVTSKLCSQLYLDLEGPALIAERTAEHVVPHASLAPAGQQ